jgi:glycosyltransferase involved in cell wall biosynthesis
MNILNVIQGTSLGGMEQSSLNLMKQMKKSGFNFTVLSLTETGRLKSHLDDFDIPCIGIKYRGIGGFLSYFDYKNAITSINPEAIMMTGNSLVGMLALSNICKEKRVLFVHYHHTGVKSNLMWKLIYFIANRRFKHIFFASKFIMGEAIKIFPNIKAKSTCLANPLLPVNLVDPSQRKELRKSLGIGDSDIVIGNAGWLIKRKRFDILLRVCGELKIQNENIKVLIAGSGKEKNNLIQLAEELGITNDIIWLGWIDDMEDFYQSIDFMIFNSDWDAVGLSPLEAIQHGIPTFASVLNGGLKELLSDKFSFFIQNNHDEQALIKKLQYAINHSEEVKKLTLECRNHIDKISKPETIAKKVIEMYI